MGFSSVFRKPQDPQYCICILLLCVGPQYCICILLLCAGQVGLDSLKLVLPPIDIYVNGICDERAYYIQHAFYYMLYPSGPTSESQSVYAMEICFQQFCMATSQIVVLYSLRFQLTLPFLPFTTHSPYLSIQSSIWLACFSFLPAPIALFNMVSEFGNDCINLPRTRLKMPVCLLISTSLLFNLLQRALDGDDQNLVPLGKWISSLLQGSYVFIFLIQRWWSVTQSPKVLHNEKLLVWFRCLKS